jgi:hypothetical protein
MNEREECSIQMYIFMSSETSWVSQVSRSSEGTRIINEILRIHGLQFKFWKYMCWNITTAREEHVFIDAKLDLKTSLDHPG